MYNKIINGSSQIMIMSPRKYVRNVYVHLAWEAQIDHLCGRAIIEGIAIDQLWNFVPIDAWFYTPRKC